MSACLFVDPTADALPAPNRYRKMLDAADYAPGQSPYDTIHNDVVQRMQAEWPDKPKPLGMVYDWSRQDVVLVWA